MTTERKLAPTQAFSLIHVLREALASRSRCTFFFGERTYTGMFVDLEEKGVGRSASIVRLSLLVDEIDSPLENLNSSRCVLKFHSSSGFYELSAMATFSNSAVPLVHLEDLQETSSVENRRRSRPVLGTNPRSFVILSSGTKKIVGSFEVKDVSSDAVGGILKLPHEITDPKITLSGYVSSGNSSIRLKDAILLRSERIIEKGAPVFTYSVAIGIRSHISPTDGKDRRRFSRHQSSKLNLIEVHSTLFSGVGIALRLTDISTAGLAAIVVEEKDEVLLPVGCEIEYKGIRGEVVFNFNSKIRLKWIFESDLSHKTWQEIIAKLVDRDIDLRSYESQSTLTLLARSGLKSSKYITSYQTAKDLLPSFGEIEKSGDPIAYRALQRDEKGNLDAHIGSFKVADNLWFNGDLFSSQSGKTNSTKDFVKEYFQSFIEFSRSSRPYPKVISAWIKGHPYWEKLEKELFKDGHPFLFSRASVKTILPSIHIDLRQLDDRLTRNLVEPTNFELIDSILKKADQSGLQKFLHAFDFNHDRFGSPLLKSALARGNHKFVREYFFMTFCGHEFMCMVSHMPEGLSPQRHQNAVWIFSLGMKPSALAVDAVTNSMIISATEAGTFPSVIRVVGRDLSDLSEKEGVLVLADPRMWELAT